MTPIVCMCALNGSYRNKSHHPNIPLNAREIAQTAFEVQCAGAQAIHVHVRNPDHTHSLSVKLYKEAIAEIRSRCGNRLLIQVTCEAAGIYGVTEQMAMIYELNPEAVSLSVREFSNAKKNDLHSLDLHMKRSRIKPQWIMYDADDFVIYKNWLRTGVLSAKNYPVLFVLGRYGRIDATVDMLDWFIRNPGGGGQWMVCAFGEREPHIMNRVCEKNGHIRVGLENNVAVSSNAESVKTAIASILKNDLTLATHDETEKLLTPRWS